MEKKKKFQFPHVLIILIAVIFICSLLSYIVPAGSYDMMTIGSGDEAREVINPDTFHYVDRTPVTVLQFLTAIPRGLQNSSAIVFLIFIVGGSFAVIAQTGALEAGLGRLAKAASGHELILIPVILIAFSLAASTVGLSEEMLLFVPLMISLCLAMGYDSITGMAIAMAGGAAGFAGAISNPFTVCVAQGVAGLPLLSGSGFRIVVYVCMVLPIIIYVMLHARKVKKNPQLSPTYEIDQLRTESHVDFNNLPEFTMRKKLIVLVFAASLILVVWGVMKKGWYLNELCAVFLADGMIAAAIAKMGFNNYAINLGKGMADIASGALVVGFANAVLVVLQDGNILNTILNATANLLDGLPATVGAVGMYLFQCVLNFFIPSGSGQAAVSIPVMAPLGDIIGVSRQTVVLAFQMGDGISNMIIPTSGILIAALSMAKIPWEKWAKWLLPAILVQYAIGAVLIIVAQAIGYA